MPIASPVHHTDHVGRYALAPIACDTSKADVPIVALTSVLTSAAMTIASASRSVTIDSRKPTAFSSRHATSGASVLPTAIRAAAHNGPPTVALPTSEPQRVLAAAPTQQAVFNPNNNTLYVLDVFSAAVDAREPATNDLKTRIAVGGKPTALALYETANTILVLDASQKRVTEIDAGTNTVIGATTVEISGTPTSISVDPNAGKILVTTESQPSSPAEKSPAGAVAVINGSTKQLETVREIEVGEHICHARAQRCTPQPVQVSVVHEIFRHGELRIQAGILKNHPDARAHALGLAPQIVAEHPYAALSGAHQRG